MKSLIAIFCILLFVPSFGIAANVYVQPGATGAANGSDWTNAFTALPATLTRGNTYYLADGSYGSYTFDDAADGTTLITIKKCGSGDGTCENAAGYSAADHDGQAVFTGWTFATDAKYYTIDGGAGGGPGSWATGHGIAVRALAAHLITGGYSTGISDIIIKHVELDGTDKTSADRDALYFQGGITNLTLQYVYIHDIGCDIAQIANGVTNFTVEYSQIGDNTSSGTCHRDIFELSEGAASNWVHRYNLFKNPTGTYFWGAHDRTGNDGNLDGIEIYGNIIWKDSSGYATNGIVSALSGGGTVSNLKFYNNTIYGFDMNVIGFGTLRGSNNYAYNNIWYLSGASLDLTSLTDHDYNWFYNAGTQSETHIQNGSGDPFSNTIAGDFALSASTNAGKADLGGSYNTDMLGVTRGADGVWDRGAFEYQADTTAPANPTYAINAAGSSFTVTFSEAVTHGAGGTTGWVLTSDGGALTAVYSSGAGSTSLVYQLSRTVYSTETVTGTYTQPEDPGITDIAGNLFASVTDVAITNSSEATAGAPTYPKMTLSTGSNVTLSPSGTGSFTLAP